MKQKKVVGSGMDKAYVGPSIHDTMVVYHLNGETGWSMVCANGKQNSRIGNFRLGWHVPFAFFISFSLKYIFRLL